MAADDDADTATLFDRARAGDRSAWEALTDRYTPLLWSIARGTGLGQADAADAVQTAWLRLVEQIDRITDPAHVGSWLATTVRRECLRLLRRGARIRTGLDENALQIPDQRMEVPGDALVAAERDAELWKAFDQLGDRCQCLLRVLVTDPPPSYAEVSAALGMKVGSIGPTRQRCLERLRKIMAGTEGTVAAAQDGGA